MEVQTVEKKPVVSGKQTVSATEETSEVSERSKEVKNSNMITILISFIQ